VVSYVHVVDTEGFKSLPDQNKGEQVMLIFTKLNDYTLHRIIKDDRVIGYIDPNNLNYSTTTIEPYWFSVDELIEIVKYIVDLEKKDV